MARLIFETENCKRYVFYFSLDFNLLFVFHFSLKASQFTGVQATPGEDYGVVTNGYVLIGEGVMKGSVPITIMADSIPELDEKFLVRLTRVDVTGEPPSAVNSPYLGEPKEAVITILSNDDTYGAFRLYSDSPQATDNGHTVPVEEKPNLAVALIVERGGNQIFYSNNFVYYITYK